MQQVWARTSELPWWAHGAVCYEVVQAREGTVYKVSTVPQDGICHAILE